MDETIQALDKLVLSMVKVVSDTDTLFEILAEKLPGLSVQAFGDSLLRLAQKKSIELSKDGKRATIVVTN